MNQDIYVYILQNGKILLHKDLYLNSGSFSRIIQQHSSPSLYLTSQTRTHLENLVNKGQLVRHTFTRKRNFHYYSLPEVPRPNREPSQYNNLV